MGTVLFLQILMLFWGLRFGDSRIFLYLCTRIGSSASHNPKSYITMVENEPKLTEESMERTMQNTSNASPTEAIATNQNPHDTAVEAGLAMGVSPEEEESDDAEDLRILRQYLSEHYDLRMNVVAGRVEFRKLDGTDEPFRQLTFEAENSIVLEAMADLGKVKGVKTILAMLLHSDEVAQYDPIREYLTTLPHWDGQNRVAELFGRLPGISSENILRCSIWMRSAVAHWLKMDLLHGNDTVPTLIGDQGCGKTVFCRRLLPPQLQGYFLDRINLSNKFDKDMALTNNMFVVLDEFDQYTVSQQAALKYAISRCEVNARPILKGAQVVRHRYASFLATTNNPRPLTDPTGSRRYICIRIAPKAIIDNTLPIDYDQLYAQLVDEVCVQKMRYWFDAEETQRLQLDNIPFQREANVDEMVDTCFQKPKDSNPGREYTLNEILELVVARYPYVKCDMSLKMRLGGALKKRGFALQHHRTGNSYVLVPKEAA